MGLKERALDRGREGRVKGEWQPVSSQQHWCRQRRIFNLLEPFAGLHRKSQRKRSGEV